MEMKRMGIYVSRTLSYSGSEFTMNEEKLNEEQRIMYDNSVVFIQKLRSEIAAASDLAASMPAMAPVGADDELESESESNDETALDGKAVWRYFWGQHQRFFMSLCAAMKVPAVVRTAQKALAEGKCVVIGIQSTGAGPVFMFRFSLLL